MNMTSDAKIGLLLGLIFIFIIAFILNGLPGLHGRGSSNQATAQDLTSLNTSTSSDATLIKPTGVASGLGAPAWRGNEEVRYQAPLGNMNTVDKEVLPAPSEPAKSDTIATAQQTDSSLLKSENKLVEITEVEQPVTIENVSESTGVGDESPVKDESRKGTEYVVQSGDSPAKIAAKFYGPEEGNRLVNIDKLMAANKIGDATKLKVGQKLVIPALPSGPEKLAVLHPESFVKTDKTSTKAVTSAKTEVKKDSQDVKTEPAKPANTREYTVASGDSLWTISAKMLGSGNRYKEILKLNSDKLGSDGSKLAVGMKLRIPAK